MAPTLIAFGVVSGMELLLWVTPLWRLRRIFASVIILVLSVISGLMLSGQYGYLILLVGLISLYRMVNLLRVVEGRMQADYLFHATRRTTLWLIGGQLLVLLVLVLDQFVSVSLLTWGYVFCGGLIAVSAGLLATTLRNLNKTRPPVLTEDYADRDLPSLTVAIPARNETEELETCLRSLIASTYPKLEILVLDDCSQNKRTPEIIRSFAHDGVRFVAGETPPDQWMAKNYAYKQLAEAASGKLLLFCGVDTHFEPDSLSHLVKTLLQKQKSMISVLPRNRFPLDHALLAKISQTNRYAWELALPRRLFNRPPVLSTCWLITRDMLEAAGGFEAVRHSVLPERHFAREAITKEDGYSFLCADAGLQISCQKSYDEQKATAFRTRYPQLHRRPELVALVSLAEVSAFLGPVILLIAGLATSQWLLTGLAAVSYLLTADLYDKIYSLTYRQFLVGGFLIQPIAAIYDLGVLHYSMWGYEFREVLWKGRNVCLPVMRAIPHLPKVLPPIQD